MLDRPHYIALGVVVLLTGILLNLPARASNQFKLAVGGLFLPLFGLAGSVNGFTQQAANALTPKRALVSEVEKLARENQELKLRLMQAEESLRQNERFRQLLAYQQRATWKLKLAQVVGRDPANWWRTLHIGLGSGDGMKVDLPVVSPEGLVGRIAAVELGRSRVVLVGDRKCGVSALVKETGETGVIQPQPAAVLDPSMVTLAYLPPRSGIKPGHTIITSGVEGGLFPKGIVIGTVVDTQPADNQLYLEARVKLATDTSRLEEVFVIVQ
jgi:rod shape-determining protein MreC